MNRNASVKTKVDAGSAVTNPARRTRGPNRKTALLRAFRDGCPIRDAARIVGIDLATHHEWLATDARYKTAFEASIPMALGAAQDYLVHLALTGSFEPIIYKGEFQYAARRRTLCKLADGTTAFADELPKGAQVIERRTVTTRDGEMLGIYRRDKRLLRELVMAWMPERYGTCLRLMPEKPAPPVRLRIKMSARGIRIVEDQAPAPPRTHAAKLKTAFLMAFVCSFSVTDSARSVGIDRALHYKWLATDAKYKAAYEASKPAAAGLLEDHLVELALTGIFEPAVYRGQFHYAKRRRILCKLADGTAAFADELPKGARVIERRTVTTRDGEMVGVYRLQTDLLIMLLEARMPGKYGNRSPRMMTEKTTVCGSRKKLMDLLERARRIVPTPRSGA